VSGCGDNQDQSGPAVTAVAGASSHAALHRGLEELLEELVVARSQPQDVLLLAGLLRRNLLEHMRFEEDVVLPWWELHCSDPPANATVECFLEDHRLLRGRLLALLEEAVRASVRPVDPQALRETLAGLDDLLAHHDQREAELLYAHLEQATGAASAAVKSQLAEVRAVSRDGARDLLDRWRTLGHGQRVLRAYHGWVLESSETAPPESWEFLPAATRPRAQVLADRDQQLVGRYRANTNAEDLSRLGEERRVEQTLRRTVLVLLDSFLDPCFS